jgi:ribosomal protein L11 methyltransferase
MPVALAGIFADVLEETALAVSILAPPRITTAHVEAITGAEPDKAALTAALGITAALHKVKIPKLDIRQVPNINWVGKVAGDFPPLPIARWIIHGAHYRDAVPDRRRGLQIDATSAFGTGEHPTTHGCLLMLDDILKKGIKGRRMLDMGCGSGILAMAWAKALPGYALGIDNDTLSVRIAKDNAAVNGLNGRVRIMRGQGYGGRVVRRHAPYDLVMANIFARPLAMMAKDLRRNLRPGGIAILSGLLGDQTNRVLAAHRLQRLYPLKCFRLGEWSVLILRRRPGHQRKL